MKKYCFYVALAMVAAMAASCKSNHKTKVEETDAEEVEVAKTILANDVLATIDEFANIYIDESGNYDVVSFIASNLTEEEKMVKPDYLLDPAQANYLVTKSQKFAALAIFALEREIRSVYSMPVEKSTEAIIRLAADLNYPVSYDELKGLKVSERIRKLYEACKERGEIAYFWRLNSAFMAELLYLVVYNPDPFLKSLTDEQWSSFKKRYDSYLQTVRILAKYDEEIASIVDVINETNSVSSDEEASGIFDTKEGGIQRVLQAKDKYVARRNALLK